MTHSENRPSAGIIVAKNQHIYHTRITRGDGAGLGLYISPTNPHTPQTSPGIRFVAVDNTNPNSRFLTVSRLAPSRLWNGICEVAQIKLKKYALERINFSHSPESKIIEIEQEL